MQLRSSFGAATLAWAALKAGKLQEARQAMNEALRPGTEDARFFYHRGMIARALGDTVAANSYVPRALALNPHFDPIQSSIAKTIVQQ